MFGGIQLPIDAFLRVVSSHLCLVLHVFVRRGGGGLLHEREGQKTPTGLEDSLLGTGNLVDAAVLFSMQPFGSFQEGSLPRTLSIKKFTRKMGSSCCHSLCHGFHAHVRTASADKGRVETPAQLNDGESQ